ncbi:MAG: response regulator [Gemmatimonadetes bacterium]|nr:response regulator [Gemmatimonadota bacterium]
MTEKRLALVVDDSSATRMILRKILSDHGFDTIEAANGSEALQQLSQHDDVRLALVDWNMPVMNGLEFVVEARKESRFDGVVMMMVTTETEMDRVAAALEAGANEYVMKPFTPAILAEKLTLLGMGGPAH